MTAEEDLFGPSDPEEVEYAELQSQLTKAARALWRERKLRAFVVACGLDPVKVVAGEQEPVKIPDLLSRIEQLEESSSMACECPPDDCVCAGCLYAAEHYANEQEAARE